MQKELDMDLRVRLTESQYEVLKAVAEASGDILDEYLHTSIIQAIQSDIDLYFGKSESIQEKLYKKIGANYGWIEMNTTEITLSLKLVVQSC